MMESGRKVLSRVRVVRTIVFCFFLSALTTSICFAETKKTTLKMWALDGAETLIYKEMIPEIDAKFDDISIALTIYPSGEFYSKLQVSGAIGDTPDIIIMDATYLPLFVSSGMIAPIDRYMTADIRKDMLKSVIDEATIGGKIYAAAQFDGGMAFWANKSMLEKAKIRIPTSYKNAWNRAEFEDALAKLKAVGVKYPIYLRQNSPKTLYYTYLPIVKSFGGDFMNRNTLLTAGTLNSKETVAAYDYIAWMRDMGYFNPLCDYDDAFYGRKESAISLVGHWQSKQVFENLGNDGILVPLPDFGKGVYTGIGSVVWAISTGAVKSGKAELAWKVLNQAITPAYIKKMTSVNGAIPSRISVLNEDPLYRKGGRMYLYREQLEDGLGYVRPQTPAHDTMYNAMKSLTTTLFLGGSAKPLLDAASKDIDAVITRNGWAAKK